MSTEQTNYPDVLGTLTRGVRKSFDYVQCAITTRPDVITAGEHFEAILLLQNQINEEIDVRVELEFPKKDKANHKGVFSSKSTRLLVGMQPAEVGFVTLPVSASPQTAPSDDYEIGIKLTVKRYRGSTGLLGRAQEVRAHSSDIPFRISMTANAAMQENYESLRSLTFSSEDHMKKQMIFDKFSVIKPTAPVLLGSLKAPQAGWVSLWTVSDHLDDKNLVERTKEELALLLPQLRRESLFKPLLRTIQAAFQEANYTLHVAEAIHITKLLTLVIEDGAKVVDPDTPLKKMEIPSWIGNVARLLLQEPRFAKQGVYLMSHELFHDILHYAIMYGFSMVGTVMNEKFGSSEELSAYADTIVQAIENKESLNFAQAYLPLVTAGIIANNRVTMPGEKVRDTLHLIHKTLAERKAEKNEDNAFIFDIAEALIDRGLDNF